MGPSRGSLAGFAVGPELGERDWAPRAVAFLGCVLESHPVWLRSVGVWIVKGWGV